MNSLPILVAGFLFTSLAAAQQPADPAAILNRYEQAIGGRSAFAHLKTRVAKGTYALPTKGYSTPVVVYSEAPARSAFYMTGGKSTAARGFDGETGWSRDFSEKGLRMLSGDELRADQRDAQFFWETRLRELYPKIVYKGSEVVEDTQTDVLEAAPESGEPELWYFAGNTGLLLRRDVHWFRGLGNAQVVYANYKDVDGVKLPFTIRIFRPGAAMMNVFSFTEIRHNVPIESSRFSPPAVR
jgi:hypothetical protein